MTSSFNHHLKDARAWREKEFGEGSLLAVEEVIGAGHPDRLHVKLIRAPPSGQTNYLIGRPRVESELYNSHTASGILPKLMKYLGKCRLTLTVRGTTSRQPFQQQQTPKTNRP